VLPGTRPSVVTAVRRLAGRELRASGIPGFLVDAVRLPLSQITASYTMPRVRPTS
jgi:hypothetical protein